MASMHISNSISAVASKLIRQCTPKDSKRMDVLRAYILSLLLVVLAAAAQEDGKRTPGRFYISLSDVPFLGSLFSQHTGNGTASNKTITLKHLQLYPILPSSVTTGEQLNATVTDANGKANCNPHNNHIHPQSGSHAEDTQKLTTVSGIILDSKIQSIPTQVSTHLNPSKGSTANTLVNPSLSLVKPSDGVVPPLPSYHNTVITVPIDGQKHTALTFQNPFSPHKIPSESNGSQVQGTSSTSAGENSSTEKPGFFEIFHPTEASPTTSVTTKRPADNYWPESFGIPSYPIMPGYTKPPALPQNPQFPAQQNPVNAPNYPVFPFDQWPTATHLPGTFGIPEGAVHLPTGIFQYPPQLAQIAETQLPTITVKGPNKPFVNIWPTNQPQNSQQLQNDDLNSNKEMQQSTVAPQISQQTGTPQDQQINHIQPVYGQHNWYHGFPYVSHPPQLKGLIANPQGNMQVLPETLQQNSAGSFHHMTSTQEKEMASHYNPQLQRLLQNYKKIFAPMPLMLQRF